MTVEPDEPLQRTRELIDFYRRTHYRVVLPDGVEATILVGHRLPPAIVAWLGVDRLAAFVSACNPHSLPLSDLANAGHSARLRHLLDGQAARYLPGYGTLPDAAWSETGVLVAGLVLAEVDALARRFEQNAVVLVTVDATARLRVYRADWHGLVDNAADIDWVHPALT